MISGCVDIPVLAQVGMAIPFFIGCAVLGKYSVIAVTKLLRLED